MLVRLELDLARTEMLTSFFETYLKLNDNEERQLQTEIEKLNPEEVSVVEMISSYRRKGREEGLKEGELRGRLEGKKDSICTLLEAKFGSSSDLVQEKVRLIDDYSLLDDVLKRVFAAKSLEEAQRVVQEAVKK